jgi:hypothetical protein
LNGAPIWLGYTTQVLPAATYPASPTYPPGTGTVSVPSIDYVYRNETEANALYLAKQYLRAAGYDIIPVYPLSFWDSYGLLLAVVELAVVVVLAGFYFYRPRGKA